MSVAAGTTGEALSAMANLIAWKLPLHGAPVNGTVDLVSAGGSSNRYPSGSTHTFERISGHQDGNETACPGAQLHAQMLVGSVSVSTPLRIWEVEAQSGHRGDGRHQ